MIVVLFNICYNKNVYDFANMEGTMPAKDSKPIYDGQKKRYTRFRVLEILNDYTNGDKHLKHSEIQEKLSSLYDIHVERKNIRECIDDINFLGEAYGVYVNSEKGDGAFLLNRLFEKSEIGFLIDAVFSSRSIDQKQAQKLTDKLQKFLNKEDRRSFSYVAKSSDITRTNNKLVLYNLEIILDAIAQGKKIKFNYNRYYLDALKNEKMKNRRLIASPYYLVNNQGRYYLVCNNNYFNNISNYRIERMTNVEILDEDVKPIETLEGCENGFDIAKYANENIYMFSIKSVKAKIRIDNDYSISYVQDWFGDNAKIYFGDDGKVYADIKGNEQAIIYWCLQYGESIELLEPVSTREKIKEIVDSMGKKYK